MLRSSLIYFRQRNFSQSAIWRNLEKVKPNDPVQPQPTGAFYKLDVTPTELEKKIMVWSGKFKSYESIPPRVSLSTIDDAKSRFRIRGANVMIVVTFIFCGYYVYLGKKRVAQGDTFLKIVRENDERILAEAKK